MAKELDQSSGTTNTVCGSPLYMAPEIHEGISYDAKVDVWSTGTIFYEMLTGFNPFMSMGLSELKTKISDGMYNFPKTVKMSLEGLVFLNCCL